jgi:lysophospholipase L1-like esterase
MQKILTSTLFGATALLSATLLVGPACTPPTTPATPTPTPGNTDVHTVVAVLFEDDNRDGVRQQTENGLVPEVEIEVGGIVGKSGPGGLAVLNGVPRGTHAVAFRKFPQFFRSEKPAFIEVPQAAGTTALVPVTTPTIGRVPGLYLVSGDSIGQGEGSTDIRGLRTLLPPLLQPHFGRGTVDYRGGGGTDTGRTTTGAFRMDQDMRRIRPSYTLIQWGVNDWNIATCRPDPAAAACPTLANFRSMIDTIQANNSLPVLGTLTPANPALSPPDRVQWHADLSALLRVLARQEGALLADVHAEFSKQGDVTPLFVDHIHPNDAGYALMAKAYFEALARGTIGQ